MPSTSRLQESLAAEHPTELTGPSVGIGVLAGIWFGAWVLLGLAHASLAALAVFGGGLLLGWLLLLAVVSLIEPPRPLAQTSIFAERCVWFVRTVWATVVITVGAVVGTGVAIDVGSSHYTPALWNVAYRDVLTGFIGPATLLAAVVASSTVPFQVWRVGVDARSGAARRLAVLVQQTGVPARWLERLLNDLSAPLVAFFVCYVGPVTAYLAIVLIKP